jgi:hypothetical protein
LFFLASAPTMPFGKSISVRTMIRPVPAPRDAAPDRSGSGAPGSLIRRPTAEGFRSGDASGAGATWLRWSRSLRSGGARDVGP